MGATASWNAHAAPHAADWATARQDILSEIAARRGRIMEFNLAQAIPKFVRSLVDGTSPFNAGHSCCDIRCAAGRQLMYFDQQGNAYPCPRANVTVGARIGHYAAPDFEDRWNETMRQLDVAMAIPDLCRKCPAQLVCDYGCHAFNVAQGNFFEVNCDATKDYFQWMTTRLEDVARVYFYITWREHLKATDNYQALKAGVDLPQSLVTELANQLQQQLEHRLAQPDLALDSLEQRYGWRDDVIPLAVIDRPRVSA
jgi:radical SAM protein with 4Fe4S-binding SPASM domain